MKNTLSEQDGEIVNRAFHEYSVVVNYNLSIEKAIKQGRYTLADRDITHRSFPSARRGTKRLHIELVHFLEECTTVDVCHEFKRRRLRAATLAELLALGKTYPSLQRRVTVVALGCEWRRTDGNRYVGLLSGSRRSRSLGIYFSDREWHSGYWFAGVGD
jgi:hypothetical protein